MALGGGAAKYLLEDGRFTLTLALSPGRGLG